MYKKLLTVISVVALISSCKKDDNGTGNSSGNGSPQITSADITKTYKAGAIIGGYSVPTGVLAIPTSGTNKTFDYSSNPTTTLWTQTLGTPTNASFSGATYTIGGSAPIGTTNITAYRYFQINTNNWNIMGNAYDAASITIPGTGTANIPSQASASSPAQIFVNFPISYADSFKQVCTSSLNFSAMVTGVPFPLPAEVKQEITVDSKVIAWGNLKLSGYADSVKTEVQQYKTSIKTNYLLSGAAAPATLLAALGVVDGQVVNNTIYRFWVPGKGLVMTINEDGSGTVTTGL
jgi:hypothetical protein